jgi:hypothetical protein
LLTRAAPITVREWSFEKAQNLAAALKRLRRPTGNYDPPAHDIAVDPPAPDAPRSQAVPARCAVHPKSGGWNSSSKAIDR